MHIFLAFNGGMTMYQIGQCIVSVSYTHLICESGDLLAKDRMLPQIRRGDLACILDTGAYGYSMCSSYNSRPRPAEVMICKDGRVKLIRRRETIEDLKMCIRDRINGTPHLCKPFRLDHSSIPLMV